MKLENAKRFTSVHQSLTFSRPFSRMCTTSNAEQAPAPISTVSIGLGPGVAALSPCAVPTTILCPLPDSPTKVRPSTHLMRAFMYARLLDPKLESGTHGRGDCQSLGPGGGAPSIGDHPPAWKRKFIPPEHWREIKREIELRADLSERERFVYGETFPAEAGLGIDRSGAASGIHPDTYDGMRRKAIQRGDVPDHLTPDHPSKLTTEQRVAFYKNISTAKRCTASAAAPRSRAFPIHTRHRPLATHCSGTAGATAAILFAMPPTT